MATSDHDTLPNEALLDLTAQIATAYVSRHQIVPADVGVLLASVHAALGSLASGVAEKPKGNTVPAVSIKKSVTDAYLICLEDGKKLTMLKRYLRTHYDMTPDQYRAKWNLPADYPMVAPEYAQRRSDFAKSIGLGTGNRINRGRKKAK
jgi:predicted transcriptional regulator